MNANEPIYLFIFLKKNLLRGIECSGCTIMFVGDRSKKKLRTFIHAKILTIITQPCPTFKIWSLALIISRVLYYCGPNSDSYWAEQLKWWVGLKGEIDWVVEMLGWKNTKHKKTLVEKLLHVRAETWLRRAQLEVTRHGWCKPKR
jgi:hypothetical protein